MFTSHDRCLQLTNVQCAECDEPIVASGLNMLALSQLQWWMRPVDDVSVLPTQDLPDIVAFYQRGSGVFRFMAGTSLQFKKTT